MFINNQHLSAKIGAGAKRCRLPEEARDDFRLWRLPSLPLVSQKSPTIRKSQELITIILFHAIRRTSSHFHPSAASI
jgi:hypothetical protein